MKTRTNRNPTKPMNLESDEMKIEQERECQLSITSLPTGEFEISIKSNRIGQVLLRISSEQYADFLTGQKVVTCPVTRVLPPLVKFDQTRKVLNR